MYDTVYSYLNQEEVSYSLVKDIPKHLQNVKETYNHESDKVTISGNLDGLKFTVSDTALRLRQGSIAKYQLGTNVHTLTRGTTKEAIERISDSLHVDFSKSNVTRLDAAYNLSMTYEPSIYWKYLGELPHTLRLENPNSVYYETNTGKHKHIFYDKIVEHRNKGLLIPQEFAFKHLLRYERRILKRVPESLSMPVKMADLACEKVYFKVLDNWYVDYTKIKKRNDILRIMEPIKTVKQLKDIGVLYLIDVMGMEAILNQLEEWKKMGRITRKQKADIKNMLYSLNANFNYSEKNELIEELDAKMLSAYHELKA